MTTRKLAETSMSPIIEKSMEKEYLKIGSAELLAALSYLIDITPTGCVYHSWRVALVSEHLAATLCPDKRADVFYAGLLHDVGIVGAHKHIVKYSSLQEQMDDTHIKSHPRRGAALMDWLPGMDMAAKYARSHHEWWNGSGYPDGRIGNEIPFGGQILGVVDAADISGCFSSVSSLVDCLRRLTVFTGHAWSKDIWAALVRSTEDSEFYKAVTDPVLLPGMIIDKLAKIGMPSGLDCEEGIERIFHIFAALVDAKDPSTSGHSLRTARIAKCITKHMGLPSGEVQTAYRAGLIHDCGRLGVPSLILKRAGRLNEEEMDLVRKHAQMTTRVFSCMPHCQDMIVLGEIAGHDHERFDGMGYPDHLSGDSIHLISRILSVADAFDAMTATASYKHLLSPRFAMIRLQEAAGTQFDPMVVETMLAVIENGELTEDSEAA